MLSLAPPEQPPAFRFINQIHTIFGSDSWRQKARLQRNPAPSPRFLGHISDKTGLKRKEVSAVFDELTTLIKRDLKGSGLFNVVA